MSELQELGQLAIPHGLMEAWHDGDGYRVDVYAEDGEQVSQITCDDGESLIAVVRGLMDG